MLLEHGRRMHTVNGFCGHCDHAIMWQLIRGKATMDSRSNVRITARNSISLARIMTSQLNDSGVDFATLSRIKEKVPFL
jgi:hypothetical protein